jgi:hypothetical protein
MAENKKNGKAKLGGPNGKGNPYAPNPGEKGKPLAKKAVKGKTNSRPYGD